jgi:hypothetical protein
MYRQELSQLNPSSSATNSIDKWDFIKRKSFCSTKEMVSTHRVGENICQLYIKGLITRIYRELKKLNSPKINESIKKWAI